MDSFFQSDDSSPAASPHSSLGASRDRRASTNPNSFVLVGAADTAEYNNLREMLSASYEAGQDSVTHHDVPAVVVDTVESGVVVLADTGAGASTPSANPHTPEQRRSPFTGGEQNVVHAAAASSSANSRLAIVYHTPASSSCHDSRDADPSTSATTPLGSVATVNSLYASSTTAGVGAGVLAGRPRSESDVSLPSVLATAPQPPPPPPRRRVSHMPVIAPLRAADVSRPPKLPAPPSPQHQPQQPKQLSARRPTSGSSANQYGGVFNSGQLVLPHNNSTSSSNPSAVAAPSQRRTYPAYNVHQVLRRAAHPLFQQDVPTRIGRQAVAGSHYAGYSNGLLNGNASTSASNFLPLSVSREQFNAGASTSMWSGQTSGVSPTAMDGVARRGFRFPQHSPLPSLGRSGSGTSTGASAVPAVAPVAAEADQLDTAGAAPQQNLLELLSTTHSADEPNPRTPDGHPQPASPQPSTEEGPASSPALLRSALGPALNSTGVVPVLPIGMLPGSVARRVEAPATQSSSSSSRHPNQTSQPQQMVLFNGSSSSSSSRLQGTPCMTYANTWAASQQQQQQSTQQAQQLFSPQSGRRPSLTSLQSGQAVQLWTPTKGTSLLHGVKSAQQQQQQQQQQRTSHRPSTLHFAVPSAMVAASTPATSPTHHRVVSPARLYSRRDLRRGRWRIDIARAECEARAALEERESYEAIRTLPASCRVWHSYIDSAFNDDYDTLGYYILARAAGDTKSSLSSPGRPILNHSDEAYAGLLSGEDDDDMNGKDGAVASSRDSSRELQSVLQNLKRKQVVKRERMAVDTATLHPAFLTAARRLVLLEEVCREDILNTEDGEFQEKLHAPYTYEHRVMTVGTLPLERFLRKWIGRFRARKIVHARQRARLSEAETEARRGLIASSHALAARQACMVAAVAAEEAHYRCQLALLQTQDAAWTRVVLLRLQERVELFSILYGGTMRQTRVCGRVQGVTLFRGLVLREAAARQTVEQVEAMERQQLPVSMQLRWTTLRAEPQARAALVRAESTRRMELNQVLYALTVHYTKRDVELQEMDARRDWGRRWTEAIDHNARTVVDEL